MELSIPVPVPELPNVIPAHPWMFLLTMRFRSQTSFHIQCKQFEVILTIVSFKNLVVLEILLATSAGKS